MDAGTVKEMNLSLGPETKTFQTDITAFKEPRNVEKAYDTFSFRISKIAVQYKKYSLHLTDYALFLV